MGFGKDMELRKFIGIKGAQERHLRGTVIESLAVAQVEFENAELARAGRIFIGGNQIIANGIAPVAAIPTTTATLALFNGEDSGGLSYQISKIGFWLGSGTPAAGATLFATVSPSKIATPPTVGATGYGVASASGSTRSSKALFATAVTIPSVPRAPAWVQVISTLQPAAANVGQGDLFVEKKGGLYVPPGYALGFGILSGTGTTPLYGISVEWAEVESELE